MPLKFVKQMVEGSQKVDIADTFNVFFLSQSGMLKYFLSLDFEIGYF